MAEGHWAEAFCGYSAEEQAAVQALLARPPAPARPEDLYVAASGADRGRVRPAPGRREGPVAHTYTNLHLELRQHFLLGLWALAEHLEPGAEALVICAGAPGARALPLLAKCFPRAVFHLYDPVPPAQAVEEHPRLHAHQQNFTDAVARAWAGRRPAVFLCSPRQENMEAQARWLQLLRPSRAALLPLSPAVCGRAWSYTRGRLLWPCWAGRSRPYLAVDCRKGLPPPQQYPDLAAAIHEHDVIVRPWARYAGREEIEETVEGYDGSWDSAAEALVWELYRRAGPGRPKKQALARRVAADMNELTRATGQPILGRQGKLQGHFPSLHGAHLASALAAAALAARPRPAGVAGGGGRPAAGRVRTVPRAQRRFSDVVTSYEKARLLGLRAEQIASGSQPFVEPGLLDTAEKIAEEEMRQRRLPLLLRRHAGYDEDGRLLVEVWDPNTMA